MNIVAIDKNLHKDWKVKSNDLSNTRSMHVCPALAQEYPLLAGEYPIVFVKDAPNGSMRSVAMLGLKPQQNVFFHDGIWHASYVPSTLRAYPFIVAPISNNEGQAAVCLDTDSELVVKNDSADGEVLFDNQGNQSEFLIKINNFLSSVMAQTHFTDNMVSFLEQKQFLEEQSMSVKLSDGTNHRLTSIYRVSEKKLNELSDAEFIEIRKSGYIAAIYAHLLSLGRINNLARLYRPESNDGEQRDVH